MLDLHLMRRVGYETESGGIGFGGFCFGCDEGSGLLKHLRFNMEDSLDLFGIESCHIEDQNLLMQTTRLVGHGQAKDH